MEIDIGEKLMELHNNDNAVWPDPISIGLNTKPPKFPTEALPSLGKEVVEAISEVNQVDPGLTAGIYLAVLSTCLSKKVEVFLKTHREPVNLFICCILDPGERKTTTMGIMTSPLYEYQERESERMKDIIFQALVRRDINKSRILKMQREAANANETGRRTLQYEILTLTKEMENVPKIPVFICDDITSEALSSIMSDNNERGSIISSEGGIFEIMNGRYDDRGSGNFDIYLKGHAGDPFSSHRIGREAKSMLSPALTVCLAVQSEIIKEIGKNRQFRGKGLLARFLFNLCNPRAGYRQRQDTPVPDRLLDIYRKHINALLDIPIELQTLLLDSEAQSIWNDFYNDIETDMRHGNALEHIKDWGSKLPGAAARIAGLLHFSKHGKDAGSKTISIKTVNSANAIAAYYREHALATFGLMETDPKIEAAQKILDYLSTHRPETFKGRDVLRHKNIKSMESVNPGLEILLEHGYIKKSSDIKTQGVGRPEAITFEVNPKFLNTLGKH